MQVSRGGAAGSSAPPAVAGYVSPAGAGLSAAPKPAGAPGRVPAAPPVANARGIRPAKVLAMDENKASLPPGSQVSRATNADPSTMKGVPAMDIFVQYERSWSIQDALDQHAALAEQREVLLEIGRNRLRVRQTQSSFAELEVEDALDAARRCSALDAGDAQRVMQLASRVRASVRDLRIAARMKQTEQGTVNKHITHADGEIEKSRQEMTSMKEVIDDKSLVVATDDSQPTPAAPVDADGVPLKQRFKYCTNCKVGGHGQRFCEYLLERPDWRAYPNQKWFEDEKGNEYHCPLGKKLVDFADESHFSRIAMYLKGRAWLEEKTKVLELAPGQIPETFIIENGKWKGASPPADDVVSNLPWFVKEADRNWGTSVHVCSKPSACLSLAKPDATYVVQQHIKDPLLMDDGRKCHIKFYVLLLGFEDGIRWHLYTFKDGYLSISPNRWSPEDLSKDTQVTIIRSERIEGWKAWADAYPKCKAGVAKVIEKAVTEGKLEGRLGKIQFEIFSADFIVDTRGDVWLFEFNMSPVLKDPKDAPKVNDADMVRGALSIVSPWSGGSKGLWDFAGEFRGQPPKPKAPPSAKPDEAAAAAQSVASADGQPAASGVSGTGESIS
eukprot:TRINITY_DN49603_c0_g1_i1.p1 TRINITY_DN49603_c0_g1~~TRINITY_DN49603_c0_g1_i1.p1  ORF type:complete len:613 (+),score=164.84 TRINITY_DN49603_c0_g1_i1:98-1936(+)